MRQYLTCGQGWNHVEVEGAVAPQNFFKILNSRYILKILENKFKKNYIYPLKKLYLAPSILKPSSVPTCEAHVLMRHMSYVSDHTKFSTHVLNHLRNQYYNM